MWIGESKEVRKDYLRRCKPRRYRQLRKDGELEADLEALARQCIDLAETYMKGNYMQ